MNALAERGIFTFARGASGLFLFLGILGLLRTHFGGFADSDGTALLWMSVNPLTNLIHLLAGLVGVAMAQQLSRAARYTLAVGLVAVPFGLLELALGDSSADIFGRDGTLAVLHVVVGAIGLAVWAGARRPASGARHS